MADPATLVHVDGVSKSYVSAAGSTPVLDGLSLRLQQGETTSLVGASGSGKSTLIALLAGLMRPDSGQVMFDGRDITQLDDTARAQLRAGRIGVVMQSGNLIPFLTAMENVKLAIEFAGRAAPQERARELLMEVGLGHRLHHLPRRMSGGESQRVSLAMALANEPDLLLADEATGELDSANAERVMAVILDAWRERGLTVLLVTHSTELAATAQRRLRLSSGEVESA